MDVGHTVRFGSQPYPFAIETAPCLDLDCDCAQMELTFRELHPTAASARAVDLPPAGFGMFAFSWPRTLPSCRTTRQLAPARFPRISGPVMRCWKVCSVRCRT